MTSGEIDGDNTVADRVWHRAVTLSGSADDEAAQLLPGVGLGPGDRALRDVLTFHGEVSTACSTPSRPTPTTTGSRWVAWSRASGC